MFTVTPVSGKAGDIEIGIPRPDVMPDREKQITSKLTDAISGLLSAFDGDTNVSVSGQGHIDPNPDTGNDTVTIIINSYPPIVAEPAPNQAPPSTGTGATGPPNIPGSANPGTAPATAPPANTAAPAPVVTSSPPGTITSEPPASSPGATPAVTPGGAPSGAPSDAPVNTPAGAPGPDTPATPAPTDTSGAPVNTPADTSTSVVVPPAGA